MTHKYESPVAGSRKRAAGTFAVPLTSLIRQPKCSRNEAIGQIPNQTSDICVLVAPSSSVPVPHIQLVTPPEHFGAAQFRKVLPILPWPNQITQTPSDANPQPPSQMSSLGSGQKPARSGSDIEEISDDELPEINLTLPVGEGGAHVEFLRDPFQTFGSLVDKTNSESKVDLGSSISQLQPVIQRMHSKKQQITTLQKELEEKNKEISQFKETEKEWRQVHLQQDAKLRELEYQLQMTAKHHELEVVQLREAARQHEEKLQDKDNEISQTKVAALLTVAQQLQLKDQQIAQLREGANQGAVESMQKKMQEKVRKISQLEVAAKQHVAKMNKKEQELSTAKESFNISEQKKKRAEQQLKTHKEKLQQLQSDHQLQLQRKDREITKHMEAIPSSKQSPSKRESKKSYT